MSALLMDVALAGRYRLFRSLNEMMIQHTATWRRGAAAGAFDPTEFPLSLHRTLTKAFASG